MKNQTGNKVINCTAFIVLALLWLVFGTALVFDPSLLDKVWAAFLGWPLVGQALVALLTLPVVIGMWILHTDWPTWLRLILVIGLAFTTVYVFFPRKNSAPKTPAPAHS